MFVKLFRNARGGMFAQSFDHFDSPLQCPLPHDQRTRAANSRKARPPPTGRNKNVAYSTASIHLAVANTSLGKFHAHRNHRAN